jgi:hypothetical protein
MPPAWRELVYEYRPDAHELFEQSVPIFSHQKRRLIALRRQEITKTLGICRASVYRVLEAAE